MSPAELSTPPDSGCRSAGSPLLDAPWCALQHLAQCLTWWVCYKDLLEADVVGCEVIQFGALFKKKNVKFLIWV